MLKNQLSDFLVEDLKIQQDQFKILYKAIVFNGNFMSFKDIYKIQNFLDIENLDVIAFPSKIVINWENY